MIARKRTNPRKGTSKRNPSAQTPSFERLEPRVLLDADPLGMQSSSGLRVTPDDKAIIVDLKHAGTEPSESDSVLVVSNPVTSGPEADLTKQAVTDTQSGASDPTQVLGDAPAPTVSLENTVGTIPENADTSDRMKVADIAIADGRVESATSVDDFESYDDDGNEIYVAWKDGVGYTDPEGEGYPGNGTGSVVGYWQAPFAEQTIVHHGTQSMPLFYDNTADPFLFRDVP